MMVIMLLLLVGLNVVIWQLLEDHVLTRLQHDAESLVSVTQHTNKDNWSVNPAHISTVYNRVRSGHYYLIETPTETIRSRSLFDFEFSLPMVDIGQSSSYQMDGPGDERWLVWQQIVRKNDQPLHIWIAEDITTLYESLFKFSLYAILIVFLITAVSIYLQQKTLDRAFGIFDVLRENLRSIRHKEAGHNHQSLPIEIIPLVNEIEMLVEKLSQRIQRTRHAIANLSHEIKRPLQVLSLKVDADKNDETARRAIEEIRAITERELKRAKVSGSNVVGAAMRLQDEMPYLLDVMRNIYPATELDLTLAAETNDINLDRDDMLELLGNLIDNACKFSCLKVKIQISVVTNQLNIQIEDDGPGVESDQLTRITQIGTRLDESIEGHGLGLGICTDIVTSYQGTLKLTKSDLGGLKVEVSIPLLD